jgi:DNA-binding response OmpR family regulator
MATLPKVLVIDDDATFTAFVSALLRAAGYVPVVAFDAMQGLMFAQREGPAVILLDLNMLAAGGCSCSSDCRSHPRRRASR